MSDEEQLQDVFEAVLKPVLKLIEEGKFSEAVRLITEERTLEEQVVLFRKLNSGVIESIERALALPRAFALPRDRALARALALDLAPTLALALDHARALDSALDHALDRTRALDRALDRTRLALPLYSALALSRALDRALDRDRYSALDRASWTSDSASRLALLSTEVVPYEVAFSAFYPRKVETETRAGLFVYIHLETALELVEHDIMKFREELGGEVPTPKTAKEKVTLKLGTMVTIVPECHELEFNPPTLTKRWEPDWVRYEFDFKASKELIGDTAIVNISIQVKGIEIASIKKCAIEVIDKKAELPVTSPAVPLVGSAPVISEELASENKLAKAKAEFEARMASHTATWYQKIFVSYSRKDTEVIRAYKAAQEAIGNDVFVDTDSIHTGEDWMARLAMEIDKADVLQLFWSENSAASEFVREEWEYALQYKCPEDKCVGIIRPVYWTSEKPNPEPPKELGHLHFRRVDFGVGGTAEENKLSR